MNGNYVLVMIAAVALVGGFFIVNGTPTPPIPGQFTLTVNIDPVGGGSVYPNGGVYDENTVVTLTATPATDYTFDHWGGAASGTSPSVDVTMNLDKTVTAFFTQGYIPDVYEDFSTYEDNDGTDLVKLPVTPPSTIINVVNSPRSSISYIRDSGLTLGNFDITLKLTVNNIDYNPTLTGTGGCFGFFGATRLDTASNFIAMNTLDDGICGYVYEYTYNDSYTPKYQYAIYIRDCDRFTQYTGEEHLTFDGFIFYESYTPGIPAPVTFYLHLVRDTSAYGSFTCDIFSDEAMTQPVMPAWQRPLKIFGSVDNPMDTSSYGYFLPAFGNGGGGGSSLTASGVISNYLVDW